MANREAVMGGVLSIRKIFCVVALAILSTCNTTSAQWSAQYFELGAEDPSAGIQHYYARDFINCQPGYHFKGESNDKLHLRIDNQMVLNGSNGLDNTADEYVEQGVDKDLAVGASVGKAGVNQMGAATYKLNLELPRGINNLEPEISLLYNSQGNQGILGQGWELSSSIFSRITRINKVLDVDGEHSPVGYNNSTDAFAIDGDRLVGTGQSGEFKRLQEYEFDKISFKNSGHDPTSYWEAQKKNGVKYIYKEKLSVAGKPSIWLISRIIDVYGNYIDCEYETIDGQRVLKRILYTGNLNTGSSPFNTIELFYEFRPDQSSQYVRGAPLKDNLRLWKIDIESPAGLFRRYTFEYGIETYGASVQPPAAESGVSLLTAVTMSGTDGQPMNPIRFGYGASATDRTISISQVGDSEDENQYLSPDINGDGFDDMVIGYREFNTYFNQMLYSKIEVYLNDKNGGFNLIQTKNLPAPTESNSADGVIKLGVLSDNASYSIQSIYYVTASTGYSTQSWSGVEKQFWQCEQIVKGQYSWYYNSFGYTGGVALSGLSGSDLLTISSGDFDGDGLDELFMQSGGLTGVLYNSGQIKTVNNLRESYNSAAPNERFIPLFYDDDQKTDLLIIQDDAIGGESKVVTLKRLSDGNYSVVTINELVTDKFPFGGAIQTGDFNGDGKSDFIVNTWRGESHEEPGTIRKLFISTGSTADLSGFQESTIDLGLNAIEDDRIQIVDYNRDGKSDILYSQNNGSEAKVLISTGNHFLLRAINQSIPDKITIGDFNGDGYQDIFGNGQTIVLLNEYGSQLQLHRVESPFESHSFTHTNLSQNPAIYSANFQSSRFGMRFLRPTMKVVSSYAFDTHSYNDDTRTLTYQYRDLLSRSQGHGAVGFGQTTTIDQGNGYTTTTIFDIDHPGSSSASASEYSYAFKPKNVKTYINGNPSALVSQTNYTWQFGKNYNGQNGWFAFPEIIEWIDYTHSGLTTRSYLSYDAVGNLDNYQTHYPDGTWVAESHQARTEEIATQPFGSFWLANRSDVITRTYSNGSEVHNERFEYYFHTDGAKSVRKIVELAVTPQQVVRELDYNDYGQLVEDKHAYVPTDQSQQISTTYLNSEFDSYHRFVTKSEVLDTDGEQVGVVERVYDGHGNMITGPGTFSGLSDYVYDGLGRVTHEKDRNTIQEVTHALAWNDGSGAANELYSLTSAGNAAPTATSWYDASSRRVRQMVETLSGQTTTETRFDRLGQTTFIKQGVESVEYTYYDATNYHRLKDETDQGLNKTTYSYATDVPNGLALISRADPDGNINVQSLTPQGKVAAATKNLNSPDFRSSVQFTRTPTTSAGVVDIEGQKSDTILYDPDHGKKTVLTDPDLGTHEYQYNTFGDLLWLKSPIGETTMDYNLTGRISTRESKVNSSTGEQKLETRTTYSYDGQTGKLSNASHVSLIQKGSYSASNITYNQVGAPAVRTDQINDDVFVSINGHNEKGQLVLRYKPRGLRLIQEYDDKGYLKAIKNHDGTVIWEGVETDESGVVTKYQINDGVQVERTFDDNHNISTLTSQLGLNLGYVFDAEIGHFTDRYDYTKDIHETTVHEYDRLTAYGVPSARQTVDYDRYGNIVAKSDAGETFKYEHTAPNAVTSVSNESGLIDDQVWQKVEYTSFSKAKRIATFDITDVNGETPLKELLIDYGHDLHRIQSRYYENGELVYTRQYLPALDVEIRGTDTTLVHYISSPVGLVAASVYESNVQEAQLYFLHTDHLGSIISVSNTNNDVLLYRSYDPWGRERNGQDWTYNNLEQNGSLSWLWRGFTAHEHLPQFGLIDMNGRMYDPILGRFLSPDPYVQSPGNPESYNRYAYVFNDPLNYVDMSGYVAGDPTHDFPPGWGDPNTGGHTVTRVFVGQEDGSTVETQYYSKFWNSPPGRDEGPIQTGTSSAQNSNRNANSSSRTNNSSTGTSSSHSSAFNTPTGSYPNWFTVNPGSGYSGGPSSAFTPSAITFPGGDGLLNGSEYGPYTGRYEDLEVNLFGGPKKLLDAMRSFWSPEKIRANAYKYGVTSYYNYGLEDVPPLSNPFLLTEGRGSGPSSPSGGRLTAVYTSSYSGIGGIPGGGELIASTNAQPESFYGVYQRRFSDVEALHSGVDAGIGSALLLPNPLYAPAKVVAIGTAAAVTVVQTIVIGGVVYYIWDDEIDQYLGEALNKEAIEKMSNFIDKVLPGLENLNIAQRNNLLNNGTPDEVVAIMLDDFINGTGENMLFFPPESNVSKAIATGRLKDDVFTQFYTEMNKNETSYEEFMANNEEIPLEISFSPDHINNSEGGENPFYTSIGKHLDSDLLELFIGGAYAYVSPSYNEGMLTVRIVNETSRSSLLYHVGEKYDRTSNNGPHEPLSTISQEIVFEMPVDPAMFFGGDAPKPNPIEVGIRTFYMDRKQDYELRNPGFEAPDYYENYGDKYIKRFSDITKPTLSPAGQKWLEDALFNLQFELDEKLASPSREDYMIEHDNGAFRKFMFETHAKAYEDAGILYLPVMDKVKIMLSVDFDDILSSGGIEQAVEVMGHQIGEYLKNPLFGYTQYAELHNNMDEIWLLLEDYALRNEADITYVIEMVFAPFLGSDSNLENIMALFRDQQQNQESVQPIGFDKMKEIVESMVDIQSIIQP